MIAEWIVFFTIIVFILIVSVLMGFANRNKNTPTMVLMRPVIYALTSTLFLISAFTYRLYDVVIATGWNVIAVALGPLLLVVFGLPFIKRLAKITRIQHIKSLPDFLSTRFGKKYSISIVTALILLFLSIPFLGIQIWYLDYSTDIIIAFIDDNFVHEHGAVFVLHNLEPIVASFKPMLILLLIFSAYIAVKSIRSNVGMDGLLSAVAATTLGLFGVLIVYFLYVSYIEFNGVIHIVDEFSLFDSQKEVVKSQFSWPQFVIIGLLSCFTFIVTPWQFQIIIAENNHDQELDILRKVFVPFGAVFFLMILIISLAVIMGFNGSANGFALLSASFTKNSMFIGIFLYVITIIGTTLLLAIEVLALSTIISNDLIVPLMIRNIGQKRFAQMQTGQSISSLRKFVLILTLVVSYMLFVWFPYTGFDIKLTFAANILLFQLAPALIGGVYWDRATSKGVFAGIIAGVFMWGITMLIPYLMQIGSLDTSILTNGIGGLSWLKPTALFGLNIDEFSYVAFWSIGSNILFFVIFSLAFKPDPNEVVQNRLFSDVRDNAENPELQEWQKNTNLYDLQIMVGQYIGQDIAEIRFRKFAETERLEYKLNKFAPVKFIKFARQQLASAIGASSARFVMALVMERKRTNASSTLKLLDEASDLIHLNRELLQSAIDNINQGICVLDENLKVTSWNKSFLSILNIPTGIMEQSSSFEVILKYCAKRGDFGMGDVSNLVAERILNYVVLKKTVREKLEDSGQVVEVTSSSMPEGGCVITFDNVTAQVVAANELEIANINLEHRVESRTNELTKLNEQLEKAKTEAEQANIDKTRFLAAASHDISQPMNAARLYSSALLEHEMNEKTKKIATSLDLSLTSVEEILVALLDISRLDSGVYKAEMSHFGLNDLFEQLYIEFKPLAEKQGLKFRYVATSKYVRSDRRHLRRILQNYISNAIKYTEKGTVLFGCRKIGDRIRMDIWDTGHGVAPFQIKTIFKEFKRLESGMRMAQGVGLGLSIVDRISKMIGAELEIDSRVDEGSRFSCYVEIGTKPKNIISSDNRQQVPRNKLGAINVVCIDNEVEILKALETLLSNWGVNGIYTETSKDALQEIEKLGIVPDAIIADYHLNFENGVFAIEKIRWQIDHPIKAILATADRSEQVVKVCQAKDITLMYKPLKPAILRAILARLDAPDNVDK